MRSATEFTKFPVDVIKHAPCFSQHLPLKVICDDYDEDDDDEEEDINCPKPALLVFRAPLMTTAACNSQSDAVNERNVRRRRRL